MIINILIMQYPLSSDEKWRTQIALCIVLFMAS